MPANRRDAEIGRLRVHMLRHGAKEFELQAVQRYLSQVLGAIAAVEQQPEAGARGVALHEYGALCARPLEARSALDRLSRLLVPYMNKESDGLGRPGEALLRSLTEQIDVCSRTVRRACRRIPPAGDPIIMLHRLGSAEMSSMHAE